MLSRHYRRRHQETLLELGHQAVWEDLLLAPGSALDCRKHPTVNFLKVMRLQKKPCAA